ncbi:MAG: membrane protein insertase YidC, partial [Anaerolineae bacterium]|nr:membrane protein insertase YidC [Anaerolineae bacterium]
MMLEFIIVPFINLLVLVYGYIGENFGLAIILFTIMVRLVTYPLTKNQMKQSAAMQDLQKSKKYEQMQKKYKNDREKLAQEQMKLFQEMGVNPLGSCLPSLLSTVIIIPVYFAVTRVLVSTPLELLQLFHDLNLPNAANFIPLNSQFLWMDLGQPERLYLS